MNNYLFPVEMLHFAIMTYQPALGTYLHRHSNFYQLQYFTEGKCILRTEENASINEYQLTNDVIALIKPGCLHGMKKNLLEKHEYFYYDIKFSVLDYNLQNQLNNLPSVLKIKKPAQNLLIRLSEIHKKPNLSNAIFTAFIYELTDTLQEELPILNKNVAQASLCAYQYIQDNCMKNISLDDVCKAICYNKTYLSAAFRKDFNITVNEFIALTRIACAKEMLQYSEYGITGIAKELGFASAAHFSRVFKETEGRTPSQYRKMHESDKLRY